MKPMKKHERDQLASGYCSGGGRPNGAKPKRSYPTKAAAKRTSKLVAARKGERLYVYECSRCGDWHISREQSRNPGGRLTEREREGNPRLRRGEDG